MSRKARTAPLNRAARRAKRGTRGAALGDMRNLRLFPILLALATCTDETGRDVADTAVDDGEAIGNTHADDTDDELANDSTEVRIGKAAAIVISIDQGEIEQANFALDNAVDPNVRAFASDMVAFHAADLIAIDQMLTDLELDALPNVISDDLDLEASASLDQLTRSIDLDFDYMMFQVQQHAEAFVIVSELADLQDTAVDAEFFGNIALSLADHREHASVILRGL